MNCCNFTPKAQCICVIGKRSGYPNGVNFPPRGETHLGFAKPPKGKLYNPQRGNKTQMGFAKTQMGFAKTQMGFAKPIWVLLPLWGL